MAAVICRQSILNNSWPDYARLALAEARDSIETNYTLIGSVLSLAWLGQRYGFSVIICLHHPFIILFWISGTAEQIG